VTSKGLTRIEEADARARIWENYTISQKFNYERQEEVYAELMYFDEDTRSYSYKEKNAVGMRYTSFEIGKPGAKGYPLYIALHSGGQTLANEQGYENMKAHYRLSVDDGIYVAVRGVRETYNTHFNPESYPLYDRLIQNMILFKNVDPNRVYLMGYAAGGDGVYGIAPMMADRFAAVSMSAGHHNQISAVNYMNTPIILQCGDSDTAYDRHLETARYGEKLKALHATWPGCYRYEVNMHVKKAEQITDNDAARNGQDVWQDSTAWLAGGGQIISKNTNAVDFLNHFVRNPLPGSIAWDLSAREPLRQTEAFYRLKAPAGMDSGVIYAIWDSRTNTATVTTTGVSGTFYILLNWDMADFDKPVTVVVNGESRKEDVAASAAVIEATTKDRGDLNYQFSAMIAVTV
jgi:hypothetical protein